MTLARSRDLTTFADYLLPSATEVPTIEVKFADFPSPLNPLRRQGRRQIAACLLPPRSFRRSSMRWRHWGADRGICRSRRQNCSIYCPAAAQRNSRRASAGCASQVHSTLRQRTAGEGICQVHRFVLVEPRVACSANVRYLIAGGGPVGVIAALARRGKASRCTCSRRKRGSTTARAPPHPFRRLWKCWPSWGSSRR